MVFHLPNHIATTYRFQFGALILLVDTRQGEFRLTVEVESLDFDDPHLIDVLKSIRLNHESLCAAIKIHLTDKTLRKVYEPFQSVDDEHDLLPLLKAIDDNFSSGMSYKSVLSRLQLKLESGELAELIRLANLQDIWEKPELDWLEWVGHHVAVLDAHKKWEAEKAYRRLLERIKHMFPAAMPGQVYLLKSPTGHLKIGYSKNPPKRAKRIAAGLPFDLETVHTIPTNQMAGLEYELHDKYEGRRIKKTEWFTLTEQEVDDIRTIKSRYYEWIEPSPESI